MRCLLRDDQQEDEEDLDQKIGYLLALRRKNFKQTESNIVTAQQVFSYQLHFHLYF